MQIEKLIELWTEAMKTQIVLANSNQTIVKQNNYGKHYVENNIQHANGSRGDNKTA